MSPVPLAAARSADGSDWVPHHGTHRVTKVGVWWDIVRVSGELGIAALQALRQRTECPIGPVAADPDGFGGPRLYFFVPPGTADHWDVFGTTALGPAFYVVVPDAACVQPPGPHWAVSPDAGRILTCPRALREAVKAAMRFP
ncbi:hypothetical protein [Streptomyces paromomycinus]|uniref:DNA primase/polymerase bifunctional N-terminal domain-containing protein n=1 Tax=Streptomyces paromomycinus TaxID=92743 RepID=A0A401VUU0_STREY|nr:hypothetical protein [Streptomyces paromomycinus]GCD40811.1 hypothetical protein GKJPGBOP_00464 [Streptomyces paromomycinus]